LSEAKVINRTNKPNSRQSLAEDLKCLGIGEGMTVIVHSSLSSMGWVCGGPVAVIQALMDAITYEGTIVMPAHSGDYSEPDYWENPPVPREWCDIIRDTMPAFEPDITPTRGIGIIAETFRKFPNVLRSSHPALSFCAWGKHAEEITRNHSLSCSMGEKSPLARIYDLDGWVLLLGVGYGNNTSFHLSEYRVTEPIPFIAGAPIIKDGKRIWQEYSDIILNADVFDELGKDFEKRHQIVKGLVGLAESRLFKQREAVDFGVGWLEER
jgi:aminoglycoside 3-N-acetyltransferase